MNLVINPKNLLYFKFFMTILIILSIIQLFRLQVVEYDKWFTRAEERIWVKKNYKPIRGSLYFSDGSYLAFSKLVYDLYVWNSELEKKKINKSEFGKNISKLIGKDESEILKILSDKADFVKIASQLDQEIVEQIEKLYPFYLGVLDIQRRFVRVYPNGTLASKVTGFVRIEGDREIGQYGIEEFLDGILSGREGVFEAIKDKNAKFILNSEFDAITPKNGVDIRLTIDKKIQTITDQYAKKYTDLYKAKETVIVVMEPNSSRILAISNYPTYDPNVYWEGEKIDCNLEYYNVLNRDCRKNRKKEEQRNNHEQSNEEFEDKKNEMPVPSVIYYPDEEINLDVVINEENDSIRGISSQNSEDKAIPDDDFLKQKYEEKLKAEEKEILSKYPEYQREIFRAQKLDYAEVFRNSANSQLYEPGSVVKPITLAIAYEHGGIPRDFEYKLGGHNGCEQILDAKLCTYTKQPEKNLSIVDMIAKSDNIGAIRVALSIPPEKFVQTYEEFGLGQFTEIELADEAHFKSKKKSDWTKVDVATASYGQGIAFTPIQLIAAWNVLASQGRYYSPSIVEEINDNGNIKKISPKPYKQIISHDSAKFALEVCELSIQRSKRSEINNFYKKYTFAGKTGTANVAKKNSLGYIEDIVNTTYVGVIPAKNPKLTILVWFREPRIGNDGGRPESINTALPAWLALADELMLMLSVPAQ